MNTTTTIESNLSTMNMHTLAVSASEMSGFVASEVQKLLNQKKNTLELLKSGISRLLREGLITTQDSKTILRVATLALSYDTQKSSFDKVFGEIENIYRSMLFEKNHSSLAVLIVNSVNFLNTRDRSGEGADAKLAANFIKGKIGDFGTVGAIGGAIIGAGIGFGIGGGLGAGIGGLIGGIVGAIAGACKD